MIGVMVASTIVGIGVGAVAGAVVAQQVTYQVAKRFYTRRLNRQ